MDAPELFDYIFSGVAPDVPPWLDYSFHLHESSLRSMNQIQESCQQAFDGTLEDHQKWRDLRAVYGLVEGEENRLNDMGQAFLAFCNASPPPSDLAKECWLYFQHSRGSDELRSRYINRSIRITTIVELVPRSIGRVLLNGSQESDRILSIVEHLTPFPQSLERFFTVDWNTLISLFRSSSDSWFDQIRNQVDERYHPLISRIKSYNRVHNRRRYSIIAHMLIPIITQLERNHYSPIKVYAPFDRCFDRARIIEYLNSISPYYVHSLFDEPIQ